MTVSLRKVQTPNRASIPRRSFLVGVTTLVGSSLVTPAFADDLVVVVNGKNTESPSRAELAAMFTTRKQAWGGGARVVPFNFPAKHELRVSFDESILEMSPDEVARYWIDRRIRGGNPPPKQVSSAQLIVRLVAKLDGAIAYVPRSSVSSDVRVVTGI